MRSLVARNLGLLRQAIGVFASNWTRQVLMLGLSVIVARAGGAQGRGEYYLIVNLASAFAVFFSFGLITSLNYFEKLRAISSRAAALRAVALAFVAGILSLLILLSVRLGYVNWINSESDFSEFSFRFVPIYSAVSLLNLYFASRYLILEELHLHAVSIGVPPIFALGFASIQFFTDGFSVEALLWCILVLEIGMCMVNFCRAFFFGVNVNSNVSSGKIFRFGFQSYLGSLNGTLLSKLDGLILGYYSGASAVGLYSTAKSLVQIGNSVPQALSSLLLSRFISERGMQTHFRLATDAALISAAGLTILFAACLLFAEELLSIVYGPSFSVASTSLRILAGSALILGVSSSFGQMILAYGRPGLVSLISLVGGLVTIGVIVSLTPHLGIVGTSIGVLSGSGAVAVLRVAWSHRLHR